MSDKTELSQNDANDPLEQVFQRGLETADAPPQTPDPPEPNRASEGTDEAKAGPAGEKKNNRSSVYLYLLILFGAAFLMLLLAYFVQQRNSETTISDLKYSMNLSRDGLLAQIEDMEKQNTALDEKITQLQNDLAQWQERYEAKDQELTESRDLLNAIQEEVFCYRSFLQLDRYYQEGDLESCAAILLSQMQGQTTYRTPYGAEERQEEIVNAVIEAGILDEDYVLHPDDYKDLLDAYYDKISETLDAAQWAG